MKSETITNQNILSSEQMSDVLFNPSYKRRRVAFKNNDTSYVFHQFDAKCMAENEKQAYQELLATANYKKGELAIKLTKPGKTKNVLNVRILIFESVQHAERFAIVNAKHISNLKTMLIPLMN